MCDRRRRHRTRPRHRSTQTGGPVDGQRRRLGQPVERLVAADGRRRRHVAPRRRVTGRDLRRPGDRLGGTRGERGLGHRLPTIGGGAAVLQRMAGVRRPLLQHDVERLHSHRRRPRPQRRRQGLRHPELLPPPLTDRRGRVPGGSRAVRFSGGFCAPHAPLPGSTAHTLAKPASVLASDGQAICGTQWVPLRAAAFRP